jgi:hypothetical protein
MVSRLGLRFHQRAYVWHCEPTKNVFQGVSGVQTYSCFC